MREHELELIAALVEGRLEDESEARALIESSPELAEEYEAQKLAYEAMRDAGTASLRETERTTLHRDIWTELRSGPAGLVKTPWYYRWAPVAAGLLVVVGLVAVLGQGGDDAGEETLTLAADSAETTTTAAASDEGAAGGEAAPGDGDDASEEAAAADTLSEEALDVYQREADLLREGVYGERLRSYDSADTTIERCVEESGLDGHRILATLSAPMEETDTPEDERRLAVASPEDAQLEVAPISFVDLEACEVVYTDE